MSECSIRNDNNKRLISEHGAILPLVKMLRSQVLLVFLSQVRVSSSSIRGVDVCACVYVERVPDVESVDQDLSVQRLSSCALCNVCANHEVMGMSVRSSRWSQRVRIKAQACAYAHVQEHACTHRAVCAVSLYLFLVFLLSVLKARHTHRGS